MPTGGLLVGALVLAARSPGPSAGPLVAGRVLYLPRRRGDLLPRLRLRLARARAGRVAAVAPGRRRRGAVPRWRTRSTCCSCCSRRARDARALAAAARPRRHRRAGRPRAPARRLVRGGGRRRRGLRPLRAAPRLRPLPGVPRRGVGPARGRARPGPRRGPRPWPPRRGPRRSSSRSRSRPSAPRCSPQTAVLAAALVPPAAGSASRARGDGGRAARRRPARGARARSAPRRCSRAPRAGAASRPTSASSYSAPAPVLLEAVLPRFLGDPHTFSDVGFWGQAFFPGGTPVLPEPVPRPRRAAARRARRPGPGRLWALVALGVLLALGSYGPLGPVLGRGSWARCAVPVKFFLLDDPRAALLCGPGVERGVAGDGRWLRSRRASACSPSPCSPRPHREGRGGPRPRPVPAAGRPAGAPRRSPRAGRPSSRVTGRRLRSAPASPSPRGGARRRDRRSCSPSSTSRGSTAS